MYSLLFQESICFVLEPYPYAISLPSFDVRGLFRCFIRRSAPRGTASGAPAPWRKVRFALRLRCATAFCVCTVGCRLATNLRPGSSSLRGFAGCHSALCWRCTTAFVRGFRKVPHRVCLRCAAPPGHGTRRAKGSTSPECLVEFAAEPRVVVKGCWSSPQPRQASG